jgi:sialate O-acetylesterase
MRTPLRALALLSALLLTASAARAQVQLPAVIADNMVLQRGMRVPVWGKAAPGERIEVEVAGKSASVRCGADGRWMVRVGPLQAGGPWDMTISAPSGTTKVRSVLVGDVWVASGQSNMEWPMALVRNAAEELAQAQYPSIRLFNVEKAVAERPAGDCRARWTPCSPETVPGFSAVAYMFGRELHRMLKVPIGLIETNWGGTPAESWTSLPWLQADPDLSPMLSRIPATGADGKAEKAWDAWTPTGLYNGMIAPLLPFGIRGAIWYQGESNAGRAYQYRKLFPTMIRCWRKAWGQGDFPFLFVQLANFTPRFATPRESDWAELREAQTMTLSLPKTGMAVAIDIGEANDIHPRNKQDVGKRLAAAAGAVAYGNRTEEYSGPMYRALTVRGGRAIIDFSHVGGGLAAGGDRPLSGFAVAGDDRRFVWADAAIDGGRVVVFSSQVPHPVAVRYGWDHNPDCNLYNKAGFPASPFRTDDWPGITVNAR